MPNNHIFNFEGISAKRGEQLEKHEVLKASLMNCIDKKYHLLFNDIWEACSDMDTYVQMNFKPQLRTILFSKNWVDLTEKKFDDIYIDYINIVGWDDDKEETSEYVSRTIEKLFEDALNNVKYTIPDDSGEKGNDRFGSIINFPNFLLHTLKIMYFFDENEYKDNIDEEIKLDDKRLIDIFSTVINSCKDKARFVKKFIMTLLQMRNLFDMYIIKREYYNSNIDRCGVLRLLIDFQCFMRSVAQGISKLSFQCGSRDAKFCVSTIWLVNLLIFNVLYVVADIETRQCHVSTIPMPVF